jgi:transcriptional regulator with XRE-family HTH domain
VSLSNEVARRLREERERQRLSQQELANRLGVASNTISRWETATNQPGLDDLDRIATQLGIPVGDLISFNAATTDKQDRLMRIVQMLPAADVREVEEYAKYRLQKAIPDGS